MAKCADCTYLDLEDFNDDVNIGAIKNVKGTLLLIQNAEVFVGLIVDLVAQ